MLYANKHLHRPVFIVIAILVSLAAAAGAQQMKIIRAGEGGGFLIPELMAFIGLEDKQLTISERLPVDRLPKEYQSIDIKKGDIILMVDGKKLSTPGELEKLYDKLAVGQEMKFGLKRGNDMLIASFKKADPSALPKMKRVITMDSEGEGGPDDKQVRREINIDGDAVPIIEVGIIFAAKDGKITVGDVMPGQGMGILTAEPKNGDVLVSLQGSSYITAEALQQSWDKIPVGDTVRLVLSRDGKETKSIFAKPEAMGEIRLKKSK